MRIFFVLNTPIKNHAHSSSLSINIVACIVCLYSLVQGVYVPSALYPRPEDRGALLGVVLSVHVSL